MVEKILESEKIMDEIDENENLERKIFRCFGIPSIAIMLAGFVTTGYGMLTREEQPKDQPVYKVDHRNKTENYGFGIFILGGVSFAISGLAVAKVGASRSGMLMNYVMVKGEELKNE